MTAVEFLREMIVQRNVALPSQQWRDAFLRRFLDASDPARRAWILSEKQKRESEKRRALSLLMEYLDEKQQQDWEKMGVFSVKSSEGRFWQLSRDNTVDENGYSWCLQLVTPAPWPDAVLARKLLLEADEKEFLKRANCLFGPSTSPSQQLWYREQIMGYLPCRQVTGVYLDTVEQAREYLRRHSVVDIDIDPNPEGIRYVDDPQMASRLLPRDPTYHVNGQPSDRRSVGLLMEASWDG